MYLFDELWGQFMIRWLHVGSGVMWIGLLWYFNFVQIPNMPKIPDDQKPAIGKVIAPAALFWFRWAALATLVTGLALMGWTGDILDAMTLGIVGAAEDAFVLKNTAIGIGMWMGIIMAFNVWGIIWPNQKKALGMVEVDADAKKRAARTALGPRLNHTIIFPGCVYQLPPLPHVVRDRLFHIYVFAGLHGPHTAQCVPVVGCGN